MFVLGDALLFEQLDGDRMGRMQQDAGSLAPQRTAGFDVREEAADLTSDHHREDMADFGMAFSRRQDDRALVVTKGPKRPVVLENLEDGHGGPVGAHHELIGLGLEALGVGGDHQVELPVLHQDGSIEPRGEDLDDLFEARPVEGDLGKLMGEHEAGRRRPLGARELLEALQ
ncbi:hypothetical protein D3C87_1204380 [compost metagenome]